VRITRKLLLPRIKRKNDEKLEKFVVANINKELKNDDGHCDVIQMQYFFESAFYDRPKNRQLLEKIRAKK
jgi:hypothetical protein